MQYLTVTNLVKSYTEKSLINGLNFSIEKGQKIALVAKNGAGKSTLLKLLMHEIDVTDGDVVWRKDISIGYLPQISNFDEEKIVEEILFDDVVMQDLHKEKQMKSIVRRLGIAPYMHQKIGKLSGGEIKRVALAQVLVYDPDMLLLDEPTNHLDLDMISWLEGFLQKSSMTLFMVTHDRYFLERVCTDIFELDRGQLYQYPGNYSYFLEKKAQREAFEKIEMHKMKQLVKAELAWVRKSPQARTTKSVFREKRFYDLHADFSARKHILEREEAKLSLSVEERRLGGKILTIEHLYKSFGEKKILDGFSHGFRHNERVGIVGKNGVGKSTFIRMILGEEPYDRGHIQLGETVVFGHYQQKDIIFPEDKRVIDIVPDVSLLQKFLFPVSQHRLRAQTLSGGEKRRLYLLTVLMHSPNFLILDEPTNDLDLITLCVLEDFLLHYPGCVMIVSHDRFFMDRIVDHLFVFEGEGVIKDFWGTYSEYTAQRKKGNARGVSSELIGRAKSASVQQQSDGASSDAPKKKLSYNEKREFEILAKEIEQLEKRKDQINILFGDTNLPFDDLKQLSVEMHEIVRQQEIKEARWFELAERSGE